MQTKIQFPARLILTIFVEFVDLNSCWHYLYFYELVCSNLLDSWEILIEVSINETLEIFLFRTRCARDN